MPVRPVPRNRFTVIAIISLAFVILLITRRSLRQQPKHGKNRKPEHSKIFYIPEVKVFNFTTQAEFVEEMERRRQNVYEICDKKGYVKYRTFYDDIHQQSLGTIVPRSQFLLHSLLVDRVHNYTLTTNEKTASTTCTKVVSFTEHSDLFKSTTNSSASRGNANILRFNSKKWTAILQNYKKAVVVRDPFRRLVSAWNDKLRRVQDNFVPIAREILSHVNPNADIRQVKTGSFIAFSDFLSWMDSQSGNYSNSHWIQASVNTHICGMPYDYVIRFENLESELNAFVKLVTGKILPDFPSDNIHMSREKHLKEGLQQILSETPRDVLKRILQTYKDDFDIFDYDFPLRE